MIVDSSLVLSQFAKKRNVPVKYDRNLVAATVQAMQRVEEIRQRRERVFGKSTKKDNSSESYLSALIFFC